MTTSPQHHLWETCLKKQNEVKDLFAACQDKESRYLKIMEIGKSLQPISTQDKIPAHLVHGCQSQMYLIANQKEGKIYFQAESDALISAGLAALLLAVYSGETPEVILTCPPTYLDELQISSSLTPNRASGLYSLHLQMKKYAIQFLTKHG